MNEMVWRQVVADPYRELGDEWMALSWKQGSIWLHRHIVDAQIDDADQWCT